MDRRHQDKGIPPGKQHRSSPKANVDPVQNENLQNAGARKDPAADGPTTGNPQKTTGIRDSAEIPLDRYHNEKGL